MSHKQGERIIPGASSVLKSSHYMLLLVDSPFMRTSANLFLIFALNICSN